VNDTKVVRFEAIRRAMRGTGEEGSQYVRCLSASVLCALMRTRYTCQITVLII
jgi:hypothetical protein